jgi:hypothetical protein
VPAAIAGAGDTAVRRFLEFFATTIRNKKHPIRGKLKFAFARQWVSGTICLDNLSPTTR